VDISRTDDDGNHPPCGDSAGEGKREEDPEYAAPKCVPKSKAKSMSKKEKERLVRRKRDAEREDDNDSSSEDGTSDSPTMTSSDPDDQRKKDESIVREIVRAQIRSLFRNGQ
jgi:hypothetical protein